MTFPAGDDLPRAVRWKLAAIFYLAVPLTASALAFVGINIFELITTGTLDENGVRLIATMMIYMLPIVVFISPLAHHRYLKFRGTHEPTAKLLALNGFILGIGVPFFAALVFGGLVVFSDGFGVLVVLAVFYGLFGSIVGPLVAIIFGPILRRIDPRYR